MLTRLFNNYWLLFRQEPKGRAYLLASFIDDLGIAASLWASQLVMTRLYTDQGVRASVMTPMLACLLVGTLLGAPLADSYVRFPWRVAMQRWRISLVIRILETIALTYLTITIAAGRPTIASILPYVLVSSVLKALMRPTRQAFEVDLLRVRKFSAPIEGHEVPDNRRKPLIVHLPSFLSFKELSGTLAGLGGLAAGGLLVALVSGKLWALFAVDVATNMVFVAILFCYCKPAIEAEGDKKSEHNAEFGGVKMGRTRSGTARPLSLIREIRDFVLAEESRPILYASFCGWLVAFFSEAYDGKMIVKHIMQGSDNAVRVSELLWQSIGAAALLMLPALSRRVSFSTSMLVVFAAVDGVVFLLAGSVAAQQLADRIPVFVGLLALDGFFVVACGWMVILIQAQYAPVQLRGRIMGIYIFVVLLGNLMMQQIATFVARAVTIPRMMSVFGAVQLIIATLIWWLYQRKRRLINFSRAYVDAP